MTKLSMKSKKDLALVLLEQLDQAYPDMEMTLNYSNAWELLVGGILGAQTTDEQVNRLTDKLFVKYPSIEDFAAATLEQMSEDIKTVGLFRNKAKALCGSAKMIIEKFDGVVPHKREDLLSLPGVGPKIASLVRGDYYKIPAVVVDTHCGRISRLLGLAVTKNPQSIENELMQVLPEKYWIKWGHFMVTHGRKFCKARCRSCLNCPLQKSCVYGQKKTVQKELALAVEEGKKDGCF